MVCCPEQLTLGIDPGMITIGGFKAVGMTVMTVMTFELGSRWLVTSMSASFQRAQMVAVVADPMVASDSQGSIYPFSVIGMPLRSSPRAQAASIVLRAAGFLG